MGDLTDNCDYAQKQLYKNETWQIPPEDLADVMEEFLEQQSCVDQTRTVASEYDGEIGWDGTSMRYAAISVESEGLDPFSAPPQEFTRSKYDGFLSIQEDLESIVAEHCGGDSIMTDLEQKFIFMFGYQLGSIESILIAVIAGFSDY